MNGAEFGMSVQKLICDEYNIKPNDLEKSSMIQIIIQNLENLSIM